MRLAQLDGSTRRKAEPTIALINIVFLMLIFFLVAAQIAPPLDRDLELISAVDLEGREPPDALVVMANGDMAFRGARITPAQYVTIRQEEEADLVAIRLVPDRELAATKLIDIGNELRAMGMERILVVTERGLSPQ